MNPVKSADDLLRPKFWRMVLQVLKKGDYIEIRPGRDNTVAVFRQHRPTRLETFESPDPETFEYPDP